MTRAVDGAQRPADPPRLLVVDLDLRLLHGADRLRRQHALAVYHAVPHLETEEGEQIPRAGDDAAGGVAAAADVEGPRHLRRVLARELGMSRRRRVDDGLMGEVERPLQPKRVEDALLHRRLEARPGDHLDDAAGDAETAAVKAPELAGRGLLRPVAGSGDVPLQRIIAFSGIIKPVPSRPLVWESRWRSVIVAAARGSARIRSVKYVPIRVSRSSSPASSSHMTRVAVKTLLLEPT